MQVPPALPQAGGAATVTVALLLAEPPAPEQFKLKVDVALSAPVDLEPDTACAPLQAPDAVQPVALVELQLRVEDWPLVIEPGDAEKLSVGAGVVAPPPVEPPPPVDPPPVDPPPAVVPPDELELVEPPAGADDFEAVPEALEPVEPAFELPAAAVSPLCPGTEESVGAAGPLGPAAEPEN